jgi:hypothetical protein
MSRTRLLTTNADVGFPFIPLWSGRRFHAFKFPITGGEWPLGGDSD